MLPPLYRFGLFTNTSIFEFFFFDLEGGYEAHGVMLSAFGV